MKIFLCSLCFVLLCQGSLSADKRENSRHVIFLIYGIGGNKTHFGHMAKALAKTLNQKDSDTQYSVKSIEYDTGNDKKVPYDFAQDIAKVINTTTLSENFQKDDKISLIMHSQGGLVGAIWMLQSLMSTPGFSTPETMRHLDSFITIGTPFWGAKTAQWGRQIKAMADRMKVNVPLPFGKKELEQMSFGSDMIFDFRMAMIDPQYQQHIQYLRDNVRMLNIVGVADLLNPLGIFVSGTKKYEDDGAVPLASARFDFLYQQALHSQGDARDKVNLRDVKEIKLAPYVMVNAMHRSPLPELENFAGIAQIPKTCIKDENCKHPTFPYLWNHILGNEIRPLDQSLQDYRTFLLDINVRVNTEAQYACEDVKVHFYHIDGSPLTDSNVQVSKFFEIYSEGKNQSERYHNHCRFYTTGSFQELTDIREESMLIIISAEAFDTRFIEMKVRPGYSSFVDVSLSKPVEN